MSTVARPSDPAPSVERQVAPEANPHVSAGIEAEAGLVALSGRVHFAALVLVVASSPFEAAYRPVGRFLFGLLTNLEGALFILAAAWLFKLAVDPAARLRLVKLPLLLPFVVLVGASLLSTFFGQFTSLGGPWVYRLAMGAMVYASACEALRSRRRLFIALGTFVVVATISAGLGLLEFVPSIDVQPWLKPFKPQPTTVAGSLRLSGTFEYANGAAIYFEMVLPLLAGFAMLFWSRRLVDMLAPDRRVSERARLAIVALLSLAALCLGMALILTLSRAALIGLAVGLGVCGIVALARYRHNMWMGRTAYAALGITVAAILVSGIYVFLTQPMFRLRLTTENDRDWYGAAVTAAPLPPISAGQVVTVPITVTNYGLMTWPATGVLPVHIGYHWLSPTQEVYLVFDSPRTPLPHDVSPGETVSVRAVVQAPTEPGDYRLQWDLVHESVTWFEGKQGMRADLLEYHVGPAVPGSGGALTQAAMPPPVTLQSNTDFASVGREQLWNVALQMFAAHPITGVGPDGFRNLYGEYAGVTEWNRNIYTNNTYLEMFTDLGLVGGLAFLWLAATALWRAGRNVLRQSVGPVWAVGVGAAAALTAFFVHGVLDYFLFATPLYVTFWFITAVAVNWPQAAAGDPPNLSASL